MSSYRFESVVTEKWSIATLLHCLNDGIIKMRIYPVSQEFSMRFSKKKTALSLVLATSLAMSVPLPSALALEEGALPAPVALSSRPHRPCPLRGKARTRLPRAPKISRGRGRRLSIAGLLTGVRLLLSAILLTRTGSLSSITLLKGAVSSLVPMRRLPRKRFR